MQHAKMQSMCPCTTYLKHLIDLYWVSNLTLIVLYLMHHILHLTINFFLIPFEGVAWGSTNELLPADMRVTAYHEAGHTLVALLTPGTNPVHKVTIEPRGPALGHVSTISTWKGKLKF